MMPASARAGSTAVRSSRSSEPAEAAKLRAGRAVIAIPGGQTELGFVRRTPVRKALVRLRSRIGKTPKQESVCAAAQCRVQVGAQIARDALGSLLRRGGAHLLHHDGLARAAGECHLERGGVSGPLGKQRIGKQLRVVDGIRMHAQEVDLSQDVVGAKRAMTDVLRIGSYDDGMHSVATPDGAGNQTGPVDGHRVGGLARVPERRLVGEVPAQDGGFIRVKASELGGEVGFEAQHFRIRMRVTPVPPRHIPDRFTDLVADKQAGLQIDLEAPGQLDQRIELGERRRVVIPGTRLEPGPHHVQSDSVHAQFAHLPEIGLHTRRVPFHGPLHGGLGGHPIHARGDEWPAVAQEVVAAQPHLGQRPLRCGWGWQERHQRTPDNCEPRESSHLSTGWKPSTLSSLAFALVGRAILPAAGFQPARAA
jgi:hypothetical protein